MQREDHAGEKSQLQREIDFMSNEQNQSQLSIADLRSKLSKRNDELNTLKDGLNRQIQEVHSVFEQ